MCLYFILVVSFLVRVSAVALFLVHVTIVSHGQPVREIVASILHHVLVAFLGLCFYMI